MAEPTDTKKRAQVLGWPFSGCPMMGGCPEGSMSSSPTQLMYNPVVKNLDQGISVCVWGGSKFWIQADWTLDLGLATS